MLISNWYQRAHLDPSVPSLDLHHFLSLYSCFRCHCLSFGHHPKWVNFSFFWDNGGMAFFLRVTTLWVWIQPYKNDIPLSCCYVVLRIASFNPYTTILFKRVILSVSKIKKKKCFIYLKVFCYIKFLFKRSSSPALNWERQARTLIILAPPVISGTSEASAALLLLSSWTSPLVSLLPETPLWLQCLEVGCPSLESFEFSHCCCHFCYCLLSPNPCSYPSLTFTNVGSPWFWRRDSLLTLTYPCSWDPAWLRGQHRLIFHSHHSLGMVLGQRG